MNKSIFKRVIMLLLTVLMSLNVISTNVVRAEDSSSTWEKVDNIAAAASNELVAITMTTDNGTGTTYVLPTAEVKSGSPAIKTATKNGNLLEVAGTEEQYGWTITPSSDGYAISSAGKNLYLINDNKGVRINSSSSTTWKVTSEYLTAPDTSGNIRYLGVYNNQDWRCYKTLHNNIANQKLEFWILKNDGPQTNIPVSDITLNETSLALNEGDTAQLNASVSPNNATDPTLTWTSDDEDVATVSTTGLVTAVAEGTATITVQSVSNPEVTATCAVSVAGLVPSVPILVSEITLNQTTLTLEEGDSVQLNASVSPENASNPTLAWTSDDEGVATVEAGLVTAIAEGVATITVSSTDGSDKSATCEVTVTKAETPGSDPQEGLVTDLSQLVDGSHIVIYNPGHSYAMSSETINNWYLTPVSDITIQDNKVVDPADNLIWTVNVNNGVYTFTQGDYAVSTYISGTYIELTNNPNYNTSTEHEWIVTSSSTSGKYYIHSKTLEGSFGPIYIEVYNKKVNGTNIDVFCGYSTTESSDKFNETDFGMQFYLVAHDDTPVVPSTNTYGLTNTLETGDKVIIYNAGSGKGITSLPKNNYYLEGRDFTPEEGIITTDDTTAVWTVTFNEDDNTYTFTQDGKTFGGSQSTNSSNGRIYNNIVLNSPAASKWTIEKNGSRTFMYLGELPSQKGHIYLDWWATNTEFGLNDWGNPTDSAYIFTFYKQGAEPEQSQDLGDLITNLDDLDGKNVAIYSPGHQTAISNRVNGDWYLRANKALLEDGKVVNFTEDFIWTVQKNDDGTFSFYAYGDDDRSITVWYSEGTNATTGQTTEYAELSLNVNLYPDNTWTLTPAKTEYCFYANNATVSGTKGPAYIEAYERNESEVFSGYFTKTSSYNFLESEFALQFYLVDPDDAVEYYDDGTWDGVLNSGEQYVIYNQNAESSLGLFKPANYAFDAIPTTIEGNLAKPGNGAYVFTVGTTDENGVSLGRYYTFKINGQYLATNEDEELFFVDGNEDGTIPENAKWYLKEKSGTDTSNNSPVSGYLIYNKDCTYNGSPVCIEYFSSVFSGWTFAKKNNVAIYLFRFYKVTSDTKIRNDVVQDPSVVFDCKDSRHIEEDYPVAFSLDDLADEITSITIGYKYEENGVVIPVTAYEADANGKSYSFTLKAEDIDTEDKPGSFTIVVDVVNSYDISYTGEKTIQILDEPFFYDLSPSPNTQTNEDKKPVISAKVGNVGDNPEFTMTINGEEVEAVYNAEDKTFSYTPNENLEDGRISVMVSVTRSDGKTAEKTWAFIIGKADYQLYFGQLHSHTTYSDGSGSLETALDYVASLPESANVDFVAFTDHSNYFDAASAANPADAMNDASLMYPASAEKWNTYKQTVANFNASQSDIVAIAGYEMTWSGGPGHINSYNTQGIVSRNNADLNKKTLDSGMKLYYETMNKDNGETLHQFNHPGDTFGNFKDFSYWTEETDKRMFLVEVGNGEGQIGAGGYYPSYEQYILALDKGWHLAPTNNQDNHKGRWGNANDARDVVLTNDFSEQGIYDAIRNLRVYATEDKNLEITYTINGHQMGTVFPDDEMPDVMNVEITLYDPDETDSISKVELVTDHGRVAYTWNDQEEFEKGYLTAQIVPSNIYYFVRVTQADGDLAVTAPVWVDSVLELGIEDIAVDPEMPYKNESATLTATLYNHEEVSVTVKSITYTINGSDVLITDTTERTLPATGTLDIPLTTRFTVAQHTPVTLTVVVANGEDEMILTRGFYVDVLDRNATVTPIATVRKNNSGATFMIEGIVTSNASGHDQDTAFFDCIYVQDATGGICAFPVSGDYKIGDKVRIVGYTDSYQGEPELQVVSIEIIGEGTVEPKEITAADLKRRNYEGQLVTISGVVESYEIVNGLAQTIMIKHEDGRLARVFIDGYITTGHDVENLAVGANITATGLASYDDTFNAPEGPFQRIRIRDRHDVVCTIDEEKRVTVAIAGKYSTPNYNGQKQEVNGYDVISISNSEYTVDDFTFTGEAHAEGVDACCDDDDANMMGLTPEMFVNNNSDFVVTFEVEDGYLKIQRRDLTVTVNGNTKEYGEDDPAYTVTLNGQIEGEDEAIIEELNLSENIVREEGENIGEYGLTINEGVITNYVVNNGESGKLTITPANLSIEIIDQTFTYNGENQGEFNEPRSVYTNAQDIASKIKVTGLKFNDAVTYLILDGNRKDAGVYEEEIDVKYISVNDVPVINNSGSNYVFKEQTCGKLTINKASLTVTTGSKTKNHDGKPLTEPTATVTGLQGEDTVVVRATGSLTDVGSCSNTYTIEWGTTKESNYNIIERLGTLTVLPSGSSGGQGGNTGGEIDPNDPGTSVPTTNPTDTDQETTDSNSEDTSSEVVNPSDSSSSETAPANIPDTPVPQAEPEKKWSVINLTMAIISAIAAVAMTISALRGGNNAKLLSLIPGVGSVVAYLLTEGVGGKATLVDKYTPLMAVLMVIGLLILLLTRKMDDEEE